MSVCEKTAEFATVACIIDSVYETEKVTELETEEIDITELEFMDEDERRETIEDTGRDPEDYDFD